MLRIQKQYSLSNSQQSQLIVRQKMLLLVFLLCFFFLSEENYYQYDLGQAISIGFPILDIAISQSPQYVVVGGNNSQLLVYKENETFEQIQSITTSAGSLQSVDITADSQWMVCGGGQQTFIYHYSSSSKTYKQHQIISFDYSVTAVDITDSSQKLTIGFANGGISVYDKQNNTFSQFQDFDNGSEPIRSVQIVQGGSYLVVGTQSNGYVYQKNVGFILQKTLQDAAHIAFSEDESWMVTLSSNNILKSYYFEDNTYVLEKNIGNLGETARGVAITDEKIVVGIVGGFRMYSRVSYDSKIFISNEKMSNAVWISSNNQRIFFGGQSSNLYFYCLYCVSLEAQNIVWWAIPIGIMGGIWAIMVLVYFIGRCCLKKQTVEQNDSAYQIKSTNHRIENSERINEATGFSNNPSTTQFLPNNIIP